MTAYSLSLDKIIIWVIRVKKIKSGTTLSVIERKEPYIVQWKRYNRRINVVVYDKQKHHRSEIF